MFVPFVLAVLASVIHRCLQELFQVADNDGSGSLTQEEFVEALSLPSIQRYLTSLDVRIQDSTAAIACCLVCVGIHASGSAFLTSKYINIV